jgi:hypothetical protein
MITKLDKVLISNLGICYHQTFQIREYIQDYISGIQILYDGVMNVDRLNSQNSSYVRQA